MSNKLLITPPNKLNRVNRERYGALDGLRAYAAIGIVMMHVLSNLSVKPTANYLTREIIPFFTDFTLLFMAVSGFSMCCGYYVRMKEGSITPLVFYKKRYARILPFFALLCLLDLAISPSMRSCYETFANLTLCFSLLPSDVEIQVIGVGWFLGVVFLFYMLFPFFVFMLDNRRRAWISFTLALALMLGTVFWYPAITRKCMVYCAPFFISGGLLYLHRTSVCKFGTRHPFWAGTTTLAVTILFLACMDRIPDGSATHLAEIVLFSVWIAYAIGAKDFLLDNKAVRYLSTISMEIYLCHMLAFRVVERLPLSHIIGQAGWLYVVSVLLTLCGAIGFSHVCKFYVLPRVERCLGMRGTA